MRKGDKILKLHPKLSFGMIPYRKKVQPQLKSGK